jgi:hypothetical protein
VADAEQLNLRRIDCNSVPMFLDEINPLNRRYNRDSVFRGVSRESHHLIPSALRAEGQEFLTNFLSKDPLLDALIYDVIPKRLVAEFRYLQSFYWKMIRNGVNVPDDSSELREMFRESQHLGGIDLLSKVVRENEWWPPQSIDSLLALAQHNGLPTRLLDWTWSAYNAAYFAAKGALLDCAHNENIAIWVLDSPQIGLYSTGSLGYQIDIVSVSGATNPNLHAQRGLFTLLRTKPASYSDEFDEKSLDFQFIELTTDLPKFAQSVFTQLTLPRRYAPQLADELSRLGIAASNMFPGVQGVADSLREEQQIERGLRNLFQISPAK